MSKVLAIAVHPDDETLGCGGALLKHKSNGDEIHWLIATEMKEPEDIKQRNNEIDKIGDSYDFDSVHRLGLEAIKVDRYSMSKLISKISFVVNKIKPNIVYLHF